MEGIVAKGLRFREGSCGRKANRFIRFALVLCGVWLVVLLMVLPVMAGSGTNIVKIVITAMPDYGGNPGHGNPVDDPSGDELLRVAAPVVIAAGVSLAVLRVYVGAFTVQGVVVAVVWGLITYLVTGSMLEIL